MLIVIIGYKLYNSLYIFKVIKIVTYCLLTTLTINYHFLLKNKCSHCHEKQKYKILN